MEVLISLIIPVYNAEKYISKCIEKLLLQTYKNLEFIFINDGSTDKSLAILQEYKRKDKRIIVLNQSNKGPSIARNNGLSIANGKFIGFVDSDDLVDENMYKDLIFAINKIDADLAMCNFNQEIYNGTIRLNRLPWDNGTVLNENEIRNTLIPRMLGLSCESDIDNRIYGSVCRCLYKASVIKKNNILFPHDTRFMEDLIFNIHYLMNIEKVVICEEAYYHYTFNSESATKRYMPAMLESSLLSFSHLQKIIESNPVKNRYDNYFKWRWRTLAVQCIINALRPGNKKGVFGKFIEVKGILEISYIKESFRKVKFKNIPLKKRLIYMCCRFKIVLPIFFYYTVALKKEK